MEETYAILCPSLMYMDNSWGPYAETYVSRGTISFHSFQADVSKTQTSHFALLTMAVLFVEDHGTLLVCIGAALWLPSESWG